MRKSERRKLSPDGLPIDPREWLAEDWRDLHEAFEQIKKRIRPGMIELHKAELIERADCEALLSEACGLLATVKRENTDDWMDLTCKFINICLEKLGDKDRLIYSKTSGCFEVVTK